VEDSGELILQVDPFTETVRGNQYPQLRFPHFFNLLLAQFIRQFAGDNLDVQLGEFLLQNWRQYRSNIVGSGNVAAENDRVETCCQPLLE